ARRATRRQDRQLHIGRRIARTLNKFHEVPCALASSKESHGAREIRTMQRLCSGAVRFNRSTPGRTKGQQIQAHGGCVGGGSRRAGEICPICSLHFADVALLVSHVEAVHPDDGAQGSATSSGNKLLLNILTWCVVYW
ncbi:unnamed protein product, partial [Ectocarpus fasciculatus]